MLTDSMPQPFEEVCLLLIVPESGKLLVTRKGGAGRPIRLGIPQGARPARELQLLVSARWGMRILVLELIPARNEELILAVAELLAGDVPDELQLVPFDSLEEIKFSNHFRQALEGILKDDPRTGPNHLGWIDEALLWIESATGVRACPKALVEQYNAAEGFALLRVPMNNGAAYWLKATAGLNAHERNLTRVLAGTRGPVPAFVAEKPAWNAWLMAEDARPIPQLPEQPMALTQMLQNIVGAFAELQCKTAGLDLELFQAGAHDQRTSTLLRAADTIFSYLQEAMESQTSCEVPSLPPTRLRQMQRIFKDACERVEGLSIPNAIVHGDLSLSNILASESGYQFIDWSEGYVGHPLISFEHLRLLHRAGDPAVRTAIDQKLRDTYCTCMKSLCRPEAFQEAFRYSPILAAASAIYGRGDWLQTSARHEPRRQRYARGVARHMDREIKQHLETR